MGKAVDILVENYMISSLFQEKRSWMP